MICDPKQCVFFPPPNGKVVTCMVLDTGKRCTPSISAKCSFGLTPSECRHAACISPHCVTVR